MPKINELTRASGLDRADLLPLDNTSGTATKGVSAALIADFVISEIPTDTTPTANSENYITSGGVYDSDEAIRGSIAPAYSASSKYAVGDYAMYNGSLYCCNTPISSGESWNAAHWTAVRLATNVSASKSMAEGLFSTPYVPLNLSKDSNDKPFIEYGYVNASSGSVSTISSSSVAYQKYMRSQAGANGANQFMYIGNKSVLITLGLSDVEWTCWSYSGGTSATATHSNCGGRYVSSTTSIFVPHNDTDTCIAIGFRTVGSSDSDRQKFTEEQITAIKNNLKMWVPIDETLITDAHNGLERTCNIKTRLLTLYVSNDNYYYFSTTRFFLSNNKKTIATRYVNDLNSAIAFELRNNDYTMSVNYFDETGAASTSSATGWLGSSGYKQGVIYLPKEAVKFLINYKRVDGEALSAEDLEAIRASLYCYYAVDTTLSVANAAADAKATGDKFGLVLDSLSNIEADIAIIGPAIVQRQLPITQRLFPIIKTGLKYSDSTPSNRRIVDINYNSIKVRPNYSTPTGSTYQTYLISGENPHFIDVRIADAISQMTSDDFIDVTQFSADLPLYAFISKITDAAASSQDACIYFATRDPNAGTITYSEPFSLFNSGTGTTGFWKISEYYLPQIKDNKNLAILLETRYANVSAEIILSIFQSGNAVFSQYAAPPHNVKPTLINTISGNCRNIYNPEFSIIDGGLNSSGNGTNVTNRVRTQYFNISPGITYYLELTDPTYSFTNGYTYTESSQATKQRTIYSLDPKHMVIDAQTGENKFRVSFYYTSDPDGHTFTPEEKEAIRSAIVIKNDVNSSNKMTKTGDSEFFSVNVERPLPFNDQTYTTTTDSVECILRLPNSYTATGTPTRLIFMAHGAHGYIDASTNHWYSSTWKALCDDLLAAGYAVFDGNVLPDSAATGDQGESNEIGFAVSSPLYVNVIKKAYDYIQKNYNVYREIFCHGTSMGGTGASAFVQAYPQLVLAESSFAGRDVLKYIAWLNQDEVVSRERMAKVYGYLSYQELTNDKFSHIAGTGPSLSLKKLNTDGTITIAPDRETDYQNWLSFWTDLASHARNDNAGKWIGIRTVPYKAWNSWQDNVASTKLEEILQQAFTAGSACPYYIVNYETGTHDDMCYGRVNNMTEQLIAWYKRWE